MIYPYEQKAIKAARCTLKKYYISDPSKVDLRDIINCEGILLKKIPMQSCQGNLVRGAKFGIINVNSNIKNEHKFRFVLAHELGHWFMHKDKMTFACSEKDFLSHASNTKQIEIEANTYASELLIPSTTLIKDFEKKELSLELLRTLSSRYNVSLTSLCLKVLMLNIKPICVLFTQNGEIQWNPKSSSFPYDFFGKPIIPPNSLTGRYNKGVSLAEYSTQNLAQNWFPKDVRIKADSYIEEVIVPMPSINSCLTILSQFEYIF